MSTRNTPMTEDETKTIRILALETALRKAEDVRDSWCADFVKCRDALRKIYYETEGFADGAPDATAHDKLCNEISGIVYETLGREGVKK